MAYYVLRSEAQELYAMNLILSEDEARQYGSEGHMAIVKAIYIWTRSEGLESFQQFLSATQHDADSPYGGLIRDMRAERVDVLELSEAQLHDQLNRHAKRIAFVAIDPGPRTKSPKDQRVPGGADRLEAAGPAPSPSGGSIAASTVRVVSLD